MKKNNAGYALPYVLVVMTVLCLVSVSIMSGTLRSLQTQQMTIQRMEDRYEAEGKLEKLIAQLCDETGMKDLEGDDEKKAIEDKVAELCTASEVNLIVPTVPAVDDEATEEQKTGTGLNVETDGDFTYKMQLEATAGTATISCILVFTGEYHESDTEKFTITPDKITYDSYTVSYN